MNSEEQHASPKSYRESLMEDVNEKVCWWEWTRNEEEEPLRYGAGTGFEDVLDPDVGIMMDLANPLRPKI